MAYMSQETYPIRLEYIDFELRVSWTSPRGNFKQADTTETLVLHTFKPQSQPDNLIDFLVNDGGGRSFTRKDLNSESLFTSKNIDIRRVFNEQIGFGPILSTLFIKKLDKDLVQLKTSARATELQLHKLVAYFKHPRSRKTTILLRLPEHP